MTTDSGTPETIADAQRIMSLLPHRYPFLMLDRIVAFEHGESVIAIKNVTVNEPYFQGHFPGNPVVPGVLVIEAMAQAGGVLSHLTHEGVDPKPLYFLAGVDEARFRRPVTAGDTLRIEVRVDKQKRGIWWYRCTAHVGDQLAVSARITCAPARVVG